MNRGEAIVLIVLGMGPAALSASVKLKQISHMCTVGEIAGSGSWVLDQESEGSYSWDEADEAKMLSSLNCMTPALPVVISAACATTWRLILKRLSRLGRHSAWPDI